MATERLDITVRLNDASKAGTRAVKKNISGIGVAAGQASKSIKALGASLLGITAIFAAGRGFANALRIFTEFDDVMRQVGAVSNATAKELEDLTEIAKEMGATTRFSASQAASGLKFLGLAGLEATEQIEALPDVLNLAAAGAIEVGQAADIATNVLAAFGLEVEDLARVNDVLVKTATSSNTNIIELGEAFKDIGALAKGVGGDFEDVFAALGKLADGAFRGTRAGTALKGAISALLAPTREEAKLMAALEGRLGGVALQVKDAEGNFIGFTKVVEQLERAGIRGEESLKLFGLRAGPGMQVLLNQGSIALEELRDKIREAGGTADEIAEKMEAGIGGASRELAASFEALKISFIETFGDEIIKGIDSLAEGFRIVSAVIKENAFIFEFWAKIAVKALRLVGGVIGEVADKFNKLGKILGLVAFALTSTPRRTKNDLKVIQQELDNIFDRNKNKDPIEIPVELKFFGEEFLKDLEDLAGPAGPIGRGAKKVGDIIAKNIINPASIESRLKSSFIRLRAELDKESAKIESEYKRGIIDLDQYFEEREVIVRTQLAKEVELLRQKLKTEADLSKREIIRATISAKETQLQKELIQLEQEKFQEFTKFEKAREQELDRRIAKQKALEQQELQADKILNDIKFRNAQSTATTLEALQSNELAKLDQRHQEELARFVKFTDDKAKITDLARQQELEKDKLLADQQKRLEEQKLENAQAVFTGLSQLTNDLFVLFGSNNKELFALSQAAAIAEATMNTYVAATKALAEGGPFTGPALATIITLQGLANVAKITSQSLAEGGVVAGHSPTPKADDKLVNMTSGEGVLSVAAMKTVGVPALNLMNNQAPLDQIISALSNRKNVSNFSIPRASRSRLSFADGGQIPNQAPPVTNASSEQGRGLNIINIVDPSQISQYLTTAEGKNAVVNVISSKAKQVKRVLA